jgi:hypothetical protein
VFDRFIRLGYVLAAVIWADQSAQIAAAFPLDPASALARFQTANLIAPRLLFFVLANAVLLFTARRLDDRLGQWLFAFGQAAVASVALATMWSVLDDGTSILIGFGPPAGRLDQFQAARLGSLASGCLALVAVGWTAAVGIHGRGAGRPERRTRERS